MIVTVTMNTALDRILTVPNFQRGQRHRASEKLTFAGGKGIIVARALKRLGVPVVATGLVGGRTGRRILEELSERGGAQRPRPDRGRVEDLDGGHRPDLGRVHGDHRMGPSRAPGGARDPAGEDRTTSPGAPRWSSSRARCRAGRRELLRRDDPGARPARSVDRARYRGRAASARGRGRARARHAEPARGRVAGRAGVRDQDDFVLALDTITEMGARNVARQARPRRLRAPPSREGARPAAALPRRSAARSRSSRRSGRARSLLAAFIAARTRAACRPTRRFGAPSPRGPRRRSSSGRGSSSLARPAGSSTT